MSAKVIVGPALPGPDAKRQASANVTYTDAANTHSDAVNIKVVIDKVDGETPEEFTNRAIKRAKDLCNKISSKISSGDYKSRA